MRVLALVLVASMGCSGESAPAQAVDPEPQQGSAVESASATVVATPDLSFQQRIEDKARREREAAGLEHRRAREGTIVRAREDAVVVRRARGLANRGRFEEAYELLQPLLERSPNGARLHCRAGFYAFKADNYRAGSLLGRGLRLHGPPDEVSEAMRAPLAMCLYNRGQVYAKQDDRDRAAAAYRASLELRPNARVERTLRELGEIRVVELEITAEHPRAPFSASGPDLVAVLEGMAPAVCAASAWRFDGDDEVECQIDRRRLNADGEGPRVDFVIFRPAHRGGQPSMSGTYDDVGYLAIHPADGLHALVFGPVSTPSAESHDPRAEPPSVVSWIDLDADGVVELLAEVHQSTATSEDGCSDSYFDRTLLAARRTEGGWEARSVTVGESGETQCYDEDEESEQVRVRGMPNAALDLTEGGFRFHDGNAERRFTLAELFERCDVGCSLDVAAGIEE